MRALSVYDIECDRCKTRIQNHEAEGACPKCGTLFRVEWQAQLPSKEAR